MKEAFLHYLWRYRKFDSPLLQTTAGDPVLVIDPGQPNEEAGPDFTIAQVQIGGIHFVGAVEIHLKASGWYHHKHHNDPAYDSVILHVVWEADVDIPMNSGELIPTVALQNYTSPTLVATYKHLFLKHKPQLPCAPFIVDFPSPLWKQWRERLYVERLQERTQQINSRWLLLGKDWEAVLFERIARAFGLNQNGAAFEKMAQSFPFSILRKIAVNQQDVEALLYGQLQMFPKECGDDYTHQLRNQYRFLQSKYALKYVTGERITFGRLRPDNFPTIRLAQLASLYSRSPALLSTILLQKELTEIKAFQSLQVNPYWHRRYQFEAVHLMKKPKNRQLSPSFQSLLVLNALLPVVYAYSQWEGRDRSEWLFDQLESLPLEHNKWVSEYKGMGFLLESALDSQAVLQLQKEYCYNRHCLKCAVGFHILKQTQ